MNEFNLKPNIIKGCTDRLYTVENTLKLIISNIDDISTKLGHIGLGEVVPNIVSIVNQLDINSKKVNTLSNSLLTIVNRYLLADGNVALAYYGSANPDGKDTYQAQYNEAMDYAENYLLEHGYSEQDIAYLRRNHPGYLTSLYATLRWSSSDAPKVLATINAAIERHQDDYLYFPEPGSTITVSPGIDKPSYECTVANTNVWSLEYSISGCQNAFGGSLCWERLSYAIEHYDYNAGEQDLLQFNLDGYDEPVFAGAMIEGYANIGDIVYVTLDNGDGFYFMILDTKSNHHVSSDFPVGQVQYENGHGYIASNSTVQLSNCEFIMSDWAPNVNSAMNTESGAFLTGTNVVSAEIVDHVEILE
ncbi:MAG: hypothetical protein Q4D54_09400 [Eubacteriales bacterium]|nr:hypothetical protein [Eubacteriales bacterium]